MYVVVVKHICGSSKIYVAVGGTLCSSVQDCDSWRQWQTCDGAQDGDGGDLVERRGGDTNGEARGGER